MPPVGAMSARGPYGPRMNPSLAVGALTVALALVCRLTSPMLADVSYVLLAILALLGRRHAVVALGLAWLFTMINPALAPDGTAAALGRFLVIGAAAVSVLLRSGVLLSGRVRLFSAITLVFAGSIVAHALLVSPFPDVSVLKAVSWLVAFVTLYAAWRGLARVEREGLANTLFWGLVGVGALSVPFILSPLGYVRNEVGFQGILNHPQAFGTAMALLGGWAVGRFLSRTTPSSLDAGVALLALFMILLSEARTGGFAFLLGVMTAVLLLRLSRRERLTLLLPALASRRVLVLGIFAGVFLILAAPTVKTLTDDFVAKSGRADVESAFEAFERSRGVLYRPMLENIQENPLRGIGWGIASQPTQMNVRRDAFTGLPVGAAVEKGVLPLAVLEEVGIVGFTAFLLWLGIAIKLAVAGGILPLSVLMTVVFVNMGESVLFSPGGMGMLHLILFTWAISIGSAPAPASRHADRWPANDANAYAPPRAEQIHPLSQPAHG